MNNLVEIVIVFASVIVIAVSSWGFIYFVGRIVIHFWLRSQLGDMPSEGEILYLWDEVTRKWYYSPTVAQSPVEEQSTLQ